MIEGAKLLKVTDRQMRRIASRFRREGVTGLNSKHYGQLPGNRISDETREAVSALAAGIYTGFGPTLLQEKLKEMDGIVMSVESVRQIMMTHGHWQGKRAAPLQRHPMRERRARFGELIQIDGSPHDWFEGRSENCTLLVFIDDATGKLTHLQFVPTETSLGYMRGLYQHIQQHGLPMALYSDRHSIFRDNSEAAGQTQFGRAVEELGIELICANSPQAKGRVERVNQTLQDRLVKEMRLMDISDMATANAWLPEYIARFKTKKGSGYIIEK
jgi:hypothetical protein